MKLKSITAENVKGRKISVTFGAVNVFIGPSFSGKTAILDSIKLGLLGYHPKHGKRQAATFALAGNGTGMSVEVDLGELRLRHQWLMERGTVRYEGPEKLPLIPAVLMDTQEYFAMSRPDRLKYIFERTQIGEAVTAADIAAELRGIKVDAPSEASEAAIVEAIGIVNELDEARRAEDVSVQVWIETMLEQFKATAKESGDAVKRMQGLVQGSVELKAAAGTTARQNVDEPLKAAREKLNAARIALDRAQQDAAKEDARQKKLVELRRRLPAKQPDPEVADYLTHKIETLEKSIAGYKSETLTRYGDAADARAKIAGLERDDIRIVKEFNEANEKHATDMKLKCCPFCKSDRNGWTQAIERAHAHESELKTVALKETKAALKKQRAALDRVTKALTSSLGADAKVAGIQDQIQALIGQREKVRSDLAASASVQADLAALEGMKPVTLTADEWTQIRNAVIDGMKSVTDLELRQKQFVAATQAEAQSAKARAELERQRGRAAVFKAGAELIRVRQQKLVDGAINAILGTARRFTDGIMPGKLDYRDGELGYWAGATWVGHETFSGTETALALTAFAVSLAAESEVRLVMIDELGIVDSETKHAIIERMAALVKEGVIDQFVGSDVGASDYLPYKERDGFKLIEVTR